ncbi:MAG: carbamoyl-phosphate synthase subunit L, partial [Candidatus Omnitrophica bacterium]|nr:carbamoyl-phosphate synthase subunit L [Candidatus Omnitrophota bacterium]
DALRAGIGVEEIYSLTKIDRWFLHNLKEIVDLEKEIADCRGEFSVQLMRKSKEFGFSDRQLAKLTRKDEEEIYAIRKSFNLKPDFKLVDTCAAEFQAYTPYFYSTYDA